MNVSQTIDLLRSADVSLCVRINHLTHLRAVEILDIVSRLGDGVLWYTLMIAMPIVLGVPGLTAGAHLVATGVVCLLLYRWLKRRTERPRPFEVLEQIRLRTLPLDRFAFPSGHTLHAVAFTIVATHHMPELSWILVPFTALVAVSRVALGLHYPSDVLAGATIGAAVALASLGIPLW